MATLVSFATMRTVQEQVSGAVLRGQLYPAELVAVVALPR